MKTILLVLLATLICTSPVKAAAPALDDFAYGCPLPQVDRDGAYSLTIPLAVYEKATRYDLGDLRVFNGVGETVPHAIRRATIDTKTKQIRQTVPFFPLPGKRQPPTTDLSLRVSRNAAGAVVTVDAGSSETVRGQAPSSWYLLDTSTLDTTPSALELQWNGSSAAVFNVSLAHSSDLSHWSPLVRQTVLADLRYNDSAVAVRSIPLPEKTLPYIRLDCVDCQEPLLLRTITAVSGAAATPDQWQWLRLNTVTAREEKEQLVFEYRLNPKVTVTALLLHFEQTNSLVQAVIESRSSDNAPWGIKAQGIFYNLTLQGKLLINELALCSPTSDRYWRLKILSDGSGLGGKKQAPHLELGWQEDQLVFVGRGSGPYTLAFGNTKLTDAANLQDTLVLMAMQHSNAQALIQRIKPGPVQTLAGEKALQPRLSSASWKKILLWVFLLAGVALLALMARTIYREMQTKNS